MEELSILKQNFVYVLIHYLSYQQCLHGFWQFTKNFHMYYLIWFYWKKKYNTISTKLKAGPSNFLCVSKFQNFDTKLYKQSQ